MLVSMTVSNIALIKSLTIDFHAGMHALTGETGAGKSIVVDSLNLALGERADRGLIRSGCERATVEALIDISDCPQARQSLLTQGLEPDGNILSILREISSSDRNICRVCGVIMPLSYLRQLSGMLVDVHGQHEHQSLLDAKNHLEFLDSSGDDEHTALISEVSRLHAAWRSSSAEYISLRKESARLSQRREYLEQRFSELDAAKLRPGEEEALSRERERIAAAERIDRALSTAFREVYEGDGDSISAMLKVRSAYEALDGISVFDERCGELSERLKASYYELEEAGLEVRGMINEQSFDPARNERVLERLDLYRRLEKRYGMTADELIAYHGTLEGERAKLGTVADELKRAEADYKAKLMAYRQAANRLTESRHSLATRFESVMMAQLSDLGMEKTRFCVSFILPSPDQKRVPTERGDDHVEFLISPNPGEPLRPLSKTASGGELSRLMLALKAAAADRNKIPCMIFDEIDTGISGRIAKVVAEKMADIAKYRQVICVTHLAQIAAMADTQYRVEKSVSEGRTVTTVAELTQEERVCEIARLIGAIGQAAESGEAHARGMLLSAREHKRGPLR